MLMQLLLALRLIRLVDKGLLNERLLEYVVWLWINDGLEMVVDDDMGRRGMLVVSTGMSSKFLIIVTD